MSQSINLSNIQRVIFNGTDYEHLKLNSNTHWNIATTSGNPYALPSSVVRVKKGSNVLYKSGSLWKYTSNNTNYNPCGSNYTPNYSTQKCQIVNIPQVYRNYYLRCWAGGQNTALSCHNGNLHNNRNCGGSYQYCGAGRIRTGYTGYTVTGACWGEMNACRANNGNATWSGSCGSFTVDSCYQNDPNATLTINFSNA